MPATAACPNVEDLQKFAVGKLSDPQADALARHLAHCPHCLGTLHGLEVDDTLLEAIRSQAGVAQRPDHPVLKNLIRKLSKSRLPPPASRLLPEPLERATTERTTSNPSTFWRRPRAPTN